MCDVKVILTGLLPKDACKIFQIYSRSCVCELRIKKQYIHRYPTSTNHVLKCTIYLLYISPLTAKLFNLNFHPPKVVSR